jgi:hypothetical protein
MKSILAVLFTLFSLSALAGDLYLVCEDASNDDFLSSTIENGRASLLLNTATNEPLLLKVREVKSAQSKYELTLTQLRVNQSEKIELDLFEEINLGNYTCLIRD